MIRIKDRLCEVTVDGKAVEALRVSFAIEKTLKPEPNSAEVSIYNLAPLTRGQFAKLDGVSVVVRAGYKPTGAHVIFKGTMRQAFSRPESDGSWITTLKAGDGDKAHRQSSGTHGFRPKINIEQVVRQMANDMGTSLKAAGKELLKGNLNGIGETFVKGFTSAGSAMDQMTKLAASAGHEVSIQDEELQFLGAGDVVNVPALVLRWSSGLEGSPSVDAKGMMSCRARILPGITPGYPIEVVSDALIGSGVWRIEKVRFRGDTHSDEWNADIDAREVHMPTPAVDISVGVVA